VSTLQDVLDLALHTYADLFPVRYAFDAMQSDLWCCGATGPSDWIGVHWTNRTEIVTGQMVGVPPSCCTPAAGQDCVSTVIASSAWNLATLTVHERGCEPLLKSKFRQDTDFSLT
jgi:hypothetical protein